MKTVTKDIFLKQMQSIQKNYLILIKITVFTRKKKNRKSRKTCLQYRGKEKYVIHKSFKTSINGLKLKTVHRVIKFQQKTLLKSYIDMNTKLRKEAKNEFEKRFL